MDADPRSRDRSRALAIAQGAVVALLIIASAGTACAARAQSGTVGRTWPIAEPDALSEIEAKVAVLPKDMSAEFGPRSEWSAMRAAALAPAPTDRVRTVVPFHTLEFDITLPDGRTLYPKGFTFNPLAYVSMPQRLVVVHPRDLDWALATARQSDFILITAGDAIDLSDRTGRAIFILEERVKERLNLTVAPVVVAQQGQKLILTEVGPEARKQALSGKTGS